MKTHKTSIVAAAVAIPLLTGCGQADTAARATPAASQAEQSTAPATQGTQGTEDAGTTSATDPAASSPAPGTGQPTANPSDTTVAPSASGTPSEGTQLPAVADPCAGQCDETARIAVKHPDFGPLEIVAYERITTPDSAPQGKQGSYALYQNGEPVGYVAQTSGEVVSFGPKPVIGDQIWELANGSNVDKYGNVYLSYGDGVTVLTPTDKGYDSRGTMPGTAKSGDSPFAWAGVRISADGEPTIVSKVIGEGGSPTGETADYTWNGSGFVPAE